MKSKIIAALLLATVMITAGSGTPRLSPWDAWRMAYTTYENGEEFRDKGDYLKARDAFNKALEYYKMVRQARPDWNQKVISERIADCEKESSRMNAFLGPAAREKDKKTEEQQEPSPGKNQEVIQLRKTLSLAQAELEELRRKNETRKNYESEISNLLRDQRILNERYSLLEKRYRAQEEKLALPDTKLRQLEDQLVEMRLKLDLARKENEAARQRQNTQHTEALLFKKEKAQFENLKRTLTGEIASLQDQLKARTGELESAARNTASAQSRLKELDKLLSESRRNADALNKELNSLRDKYREKLASSTAGGIANRKLLEENKKLQDSNFQLRKNGEEYAARAIRLERDMEKIRQQLSGELKKNAVLQSRNAGNDAELKRLTKELEREKANSTILNRELESVRQLSVSSSAEMKKLTGENSELKKRLKFRDSEDFKNLTAARADRKNMKEQLLKQEQNIAELQAQLKISNEKYAAMEKSAQETAVENRKLHAQRINYENQLKNLTGISKDSRELAKRYGELQKNFTALQAENRQNKLAADAAKPREAELARIKLRLAELDGLKQQLRREQSFNEQLNAVKNNLEREVRRLRPMGEENNTLKARLSDYDMLKKEVERLRKLNTELAAAQNLSVQVADLKNEVAKLAPQAAEAAKLSKQNQELVQAKILWENENAKMKLKIAALEQKEELLKGVRSDLAKRDMDLQTANKNILVLNKEIRKLKGKEILLSDLQQKSRRLASDQAATLTRLRKIEEENRLLKAELTAVKLQAEAELQTAKTQALAQLSAAQKQADAKISEVQKQADEKLSQAQKQAKEQLSAVQKQADEKLSQAQKQAKAQLSAVQKQADEKIESAQKKAQAQLSAVQKQADEKFESAQRKAQAQLSAAQQQAQKQHQADNSAVTARNRLILELRKENALLKSVNAKNNDLEQSLAEMRIANNRMRKDLEELRAVRAELLRVSQALSKNTVELDNVKKQNQTLIDSANAVRGVADENRKVRALNADLANRSLKAESELASLKSELANYNRLRAELERLRKLNTELADAKRLEGELAQAKLTILRLEQMKDELVRQRKLNEELTTARARLEKELANRPMPAFAPADFAAGDPAKPIGKPEDYISAGRIAARDEKEDLAIWNYRTALKLDPDNAEAAELLGKMLLLKGDFNAAAPMLSRARNAKPESIDLALDTAYAYINLKRYGNAEAVIEPLLKRNKEHPQLQIAAAMIAAGNGQHAKAAGLLRLAAARRPRDPQPKLELARLLFHNDASQIFEAVKLYETARRLGAEPDLELEPKLAPLLDKRRNMNNFLNAAATEAARNKDWNSVIWYNKQLIELDREPEKYRPRLAFAQYKKGSSGAALETLTMGNLTPLALLVKAYIHQMRKESREARQAAAQARAMNGNKVINLPAEWREFLLDFRNSGGFLNDYAK